jgi:hypothetical protein
MLRALRYLPMLLLTAGVAIAAPACTAQVYGYRGDYYREAQRRAYENGYHEGVQAGEKDGRRGRGYSLERHDDWRDADEGYRRDFGDREWYRRAFREGFRAGYNQAFNRYGYYPRGGIVYPVPAPIYPTYPTYPSGGGIAVPRGGYASSAAQVGYRDGFEVGRDDARDRESYDPARSRRYRDGDRDYDSRYGSRDDYKREYRAAFQQGYQDGYRGTRRD